MSLGGIKSHVSSLFLLYRACLPPHKFSSEPSEQSFERSQTQPFGMHCSPLLHKNSLLGQKVLFTKNRSLGKNKLQ